MRPNGVAFIGPQPWREILSEIARCSGLETGGVLLGWWSVPPSIRGSEVQITTAVGPGPGATHRRTSFIPDHEYQTLQVAAIYEASGRTAIYLGDWHCHPVGPATVSATDRSTLHRIMREPSARMPTPLMLIVSAQDPTRSACYVARTTRPCWAPRRQWTTTTPLDLRMPF